MLPICRSLLSSPRLLFPRERISFDLSLYLVANRPSFRDERVFFSKILAGVKGGISCVQLRDHESDFNTAVTTALRLKQLLKGVPLFVNTRQCCAVALESGADGVFLEDGSCYKEARTILGQRAIIGTSIKTLTAALAIKNDPDIDYLSFKIDRSKSTCPRNDEIWDLEEFEKTRPLLPHRIVAIGGITLSNAASIYQRLQKGDGLAMAGGLMNSEDPRQTAQSIHEIYQQLRK